jgi:ABC-type transport system substrate-binding protein
MRKCDLLVQARRECDTVWYRQGWIVMRSVNVVSLALASTLATTFVGQAASENVLRWASAGGVLTWDPHVIDETPSLVGFRQVYESLATIDADLILRPALATSWQLLDPITWRFELREGVTFHDGAPLSAEDVVFSLERARGKATALASYTSSIAALKAVDDDTVEISTKRPDMLLPVNSSLAGRWAERAAEHEAHAQAVRSLLGDAGGPDLER